MYIILLILILLSISLCYYSQNSLKEGVDNTQQVQINENTANINFLQNKMKELINLRQVITNLTNSIQTSENILSNLNQKLDDQEQQYNQNLNNIRDGNYNN